MPSDVEAFLRSRRKNLIRDEKRDDLMTGATKAAY
jgi:hypothetical protein